MKATQYKFYLSIDWVTRREALPVYKADLALEYELESGQYFHRSNLSGKIDFVGDDYDWIMAQPFESQYHLYIQVSHDNGVTFTDYWHGLFTRTDCEVNVDDKRVVVQPQVYDDYTTLMRGIEREYNITELGCSDYTCNIQNKGVAQFYFPNNDSIDCRMGYATFDGDAEEIGNYELRNTYRMEICGRIGYVKITAMKSGGYYPTNDRSGTYAGAFFLSGESGGVNMYESSMTMRNQANARIAAAWYADNTIAFSLQENGTPTHAVTRTSIGWNTLKKGEMTPVSGQTGKYAYEIRFIPVWGRVLTNTEDSTIEIEGDSVQVYNRPTSDITDTCPNYKRIAPLSEDYFAEKPDYHMIWISNRLTTTATEWGQSSQGLWFLPPNDTDKFQPLARGSWVEGVSYWSAPVDITGASYDYELGNAYLLSEVIQRLLNKIGNGAYYHNNTAEYSNLFYDSNSLWLSGYQLAITPKSNVLSFRYSEAASKGTITLKMVLDMLANTFRAYWWVDSDRKLHIEHLSYFMRGGSYVGSAWQVGADLSTLQNTRNGKMWDYGKSTYTFDKSQMPERYVFKWMDDCSRMFEGQPIIISSNFVEQDKKEEISVSNFTTDVDYMVANPTEMSKDGFAMLAVRSDNWQFRGNTQTFDNNDAAIYPLENTAGNDIEIEFTLTCDSDNNEPVYMYWWDSAHQHDYDVSIETIYAQPSDEQPQPRYRKLTTPVLYDNAELFLQGGTSGVTYTITMINVTGGALTLHNPRVATRVNGVVVSNYVSNYALSWEYILPRCWRYGLPAPNASFNGETPIVTTLVARTKTQTTKLPVGAEDDPDVRKLIKTGVGLGEIGKMSVNLSSRVATLTLKHDIQ